MNLAARKLELMQQLMLVDNEHVLDQVQSLLHADNGYDLTDAQKTELLVRKKKFESGKSKDYSLGEAKDILFAREK